jgi:hypothetical protein
MLDAILQEHAGRKISRSIKRANTTREYITVIVKIADPRIKHGTIERAMQEQIKLREAVARHRHLAAAR